jgi:adenosylmethionine-8-amino-7-oxononanoate aminotransferase
MSLAARDRAFIWHPFSQEKTAGFPIPITKGEGVYLYDESGKSYLDLISSWWVNLHGHGNSVIAEAIYQQAQKLEHVIFSGFTHESAVQLCESLSEILPLSLARFFFSDNGSTAVEVALKMAYQYWQNKGQSNRRLFLSFEGGYHGDTFGAMSVGKDSHFHSAFQKLFFEVHTLEYPATWNNDDTIYEKEKRVLKQLDLFLAKHAHNCAAMILEPLVQGASGMRFCRPQFLQKMIDKLRERDILIIFDEVMTGFGRTGTLFALDQVGRTPDFICLSKGLTGGFLPLSLTVTTHEIYDAFLGDTFQTAFAHGHSYTANPLGCAAAIASLKLLRSPEVQQQIHQIAHVHQERLGQFAQNKSSLCNFRSKGTIAAFDLAEESVSYGHPRSEFLRKQLHEKGLLMRPLGRTFYLLPPYCLSETELHHAYDIIEEVMKK